MFLLAPATKEIQVVCFEVFFPSKSSTDNIKDRSSCVTNRLKVMKISLMHEAHNTAIYLIGNTFRFVILLLLSLKC